MWAMHQMHMRGLEVSPIATFKKWQSLGRQVNKGSKAIALIMPFTFKDKENGDKPKTVFVPKNNWFAMSQTTGEDVEFPKTEFDFEKAMQNLNITKVAFSHTDGNTQGYAQKRQIAINPIAQLPIKTMIHEMAHVILGHTENMPNGLVDEVAMSRDLREAEAEGVALCVSLALGYQEHVPYCVGYVKSWRKEQEFPVDSMKKVFRVTNEILKAGQDKPVSTE